MENRQTDFNEERRGLVKEILELQEKITFLEKRTEFFQKAVQDLLRIQAENRDLKYKIQKLEGTI